MIRAVLFLVVAGCGGSSFCTREWCGVEPTDESIASCEEQLAPCSASDERLINEYFDCVDEAGDMCGTGTGEDDGEAFATCATGLLGMSEECMNAFLSPVTLTGS